MKYFLIVLFLMVPYIVDGCQCSDKPSFKSSVKDAKAIIVGNVIKEEYVKSVFKDSVGFILYPHSVEYATRMEALGVKRFYVVVEQTFKSPVFTDTIFVYSYAGAGICGYSVEINKRYIIYADEYTFQINSDGGNKKSRVKSLFTSACMRTMEYSEEEMRSLKKKFSKRRKSRK